MVGQSTNDDEYESNWVTKESLSMANSLLNLHLIYQTTKSALMLLTADSSNGNLAEQSVSQIKPLLNQVLLAQSGR